MMIIGELECVMQTAQMMYFQKIFGCHRLKYLKLDKKAHMMVCPYAWYRGQNALLHGD